MSGGGAIREALRPAALLRPVLDVLVPEDAAAVGRRIRGASLWLAVAAWLLPAFPALGTETTVRRAVICAAFVATAVTAHLHSRSQLSRPGRTRVALPALCLLSAVVVAFCGGVWGFGFLAFAAFVAGAAQARRRFLPLPFPAPEPDPLPPIPGGPPSWLHGLAWLALSVFLMKEYVGQAMVVPTGSMQPTIMGAAGRTAGGDWLFVERFRVLFRDPLRWEIVVFEFPLFRERYFVKRVVGLPGERVEIRNGDIWVNGKIAKKPPVVQSTMWRELFPRPNLLAAAKPLSRAFTQDVASGGDWKRVSDTEVRCVPAQDRASFAFFGGGGAFTDLRLEFTAVPDVHAVVRARIISRGVPISLVLDAAGAQGDSYLDVGGKRSGPADVRPSGGEALRVELCVADGEAWAMVDGREVARADVPVEARGKSRVEIGASDAPVSFRDVSVHRDIAYDAGGGPGVYDVPKDGFFFLGDNVEGSDDSRKWRTDLFHPPGGGAAIRAADEYPDENGNPRRGMIRVEDGRYRFLDVDGVPRDLPVEGTKRERGVPSPFARRDHLVGLAMMIIWPFIPRDAGFRPRLLP